MMVWSRYAIEERRIGSAVMEDCTIPATTSPAGPLPKTADAVDEEEDSETSPFRQLLPIRGGRLP